MAPPTLLVIGGNGQTGVEVIRACAASAAKPPVHAFCRTPSKLSESDAAHCVSVIEGDARSAEDIARALEQAKPDAVVVAVGRSEDLGPTDVRAASAKALMDSVAPGEKFDQVKIVVVSSVGAGGTKLHIGFGIGMLLGMRLKHVLADHDRQEKEIWDRLADQKNRALVLHTTGLTTGQPAGEVCIFEGKIPHPRIDRAVVARFIVAELCGTCPNFGKAISITTKK
ncbi:unnamed protein product [Chondrus crispus]|uniref:NAD(P)-binding domain-containing protein n=1 Tax=Chondrus crispus TaxID=2769 RepID=S0F2U9_CHOCR|nr:unnamed protein product [Chondrus crispus]CDF77430.1 unnamed protein product [Chondrus crispus]|eukprot:XP_005712304.1 unnamed protein product [Chondrus crispus]